MIPGVHKPVRIQKILESPIGFLVSKLMNRGSFGSRFSAIFGKKPSTQELDEHWTIIQYNGGKKIQHCLISYMAERIRNKEKWVKILASSSVPQCLIDGPFDPVSGKHLAEAVAEQWNNNISESGEFKKGVNAVSLLPSQFGHYPQLECSSMVISRFYNFMDANFKI